MGVKGGPILFLSKPTWLCVKEVISPLLLNDELPVINYIFGKLIHQFH